MEKQYAVYIMASKRNGTLYIGMTSDLKKRVWQHKNILFEGFTKKYRIKRLVYFEVYISVEEAILREKRLNNGTENGKSAQS